MRSKDLGVLRLPGLWRSSSGPEQALPLIFVYLIYCAVEFAAHAGDVRCVKVGRKSSGVIVTGGDDHKVNLFAVGRTTASLVRPCIVLGFTPCPSTASEHPAMLPTHAAPHT